MRSIWGETCASLEQLMLILASEPQELWQPLKCLNDSNHYRSYCFHISLPQRVLTVLVCGLISALTTGSVGLEQCGERRGNSAAPKLHNLGNYFFHKVLWFTKAWEFPQSLLVTGRGGRMEHSQCLQLSPPPCSAMEQVPRAFPASVCSSV